MLISSQTVREKGEKNGQEQSLQLTIKKTEINSVKF